MSGAIKNHGQLWDGRRYHSLDYHLKQTYGEKVYRLSLNGGMTCPNRDGTLAKGGCIFCSAGGSGDFAGNAALSVTEQIAQQKKRLASKTDCKKFIAYFQAYTNTYADISYLRNLYLEALMSPDIIALSIATRPDCIGSDVLSLIQELSSIKPIWIELGLQTVHASTAAFIRSGFTYECFLDAVFRLHSAKIPVIAHLILGLPNETKEMMMTSIDTVASLPLAGIKLQLLHILKGTPLADFYKEHPFPLFTMEDYCAFVPQCLARLPEDLVIHRITGDGPKNLLLAPMWSTDKKRVLNLIQKNMKLFDLWQGKFYPPDKLPAGKDMIYGRTKYTL